MNANAMMVDPTWAWAAFEPTPEQPWDRRRAAHLLRRAGFGGTWKEIEAARQAGMEETVDRLLAAKAATTDFQASGDSFAETILATGDPQQLAAWWAYVMLYTPRPLLENMTLFWHGHFATGADKVEDARLMYNQNRLLRGHALGNFAQLTHAISRDPAMLIYLDSATNRKAHPNENYARELMELFCLGEGNYNERDVQELARCFTGWEIRRGSFRFNRFQHDTGMKTILGRSGAFPDSAAVDVVLEQPTASQFVITKLIRYFIADEPRPSPSLVEPLAAELREYDWDIGRVVRRILSSRLFYSEHALGRKVRSPVDLLVGLLRALEATTNTFELSNELRQLGHGLFYPPNVKGWDGGRAWINSSTLLGRTNAVGQLIRHEKTRFAGGDLASYFEQMQTTSAADIVQRLCDLTLAVAPPASVKQRLVQVIESGRGEQNDRIAEAIHALSATPECQLA